MMKKALVVGINNYINVPPLYGCVNDARSVKKVLERNADGSLNFGVKFLAAENNDYVHKGVLRTAIQELFNDDSEVVLLYFAGHGFVDSTGGYIATSDFMNAGDGIPINDIMVWANQSPAKNKLVILDSCHSGSAGQMAIAPTVSAICEGMTILTASSADQYASENNGHGVFTGLLVDALEGSAANLLGDVSPGSVYAHIDMSLGPWDQRPIFKANVRRFLSLRRVEPPIVFNKLLRITELFPESGYILPLNPAYEPERYGIEPEGTPLPDPARVEEFEILQCFHRLNLVVPVDAPYLWHAAMQSKACKLTPLGEHYRYLVAIGRL